MSSTIAKIQEVCLDCTEIAKRLRKDLKAAFPGTKFGVTSSRYASGSSVNASWTDGPRMSQVEAFTKRYAYRHFNGSDDSTSFSRDLVLTDEGPVMQTGYSFVFAHRRHSDEAFGAILKALCERYGIEYAGPRTPDRVIQFDGMTPDQPLHDREYLHTVAYQIFARTDYRTGKVACHYCNEIHEGECA